MNYSSWNDLKFKSPLYRQYKGADQDDLFNAWNDQALDEGLSIPVSVKTIMDTWTFQMGYPLVTVTRNYDTGSADVTQVNLLNPFIRCWIIWMNFLRSDSWGCPAMIRRFTVGGFRSLTKQQRTQHQPGGSANCPLQESTSALQTHSGSSSTSIRTVIFSMCTSI